MTSPQHHVPETILIGYAAGELPEALDLAVACHMTVCATCRARSAALDIVGGDLLASTDAQPMSAGALDAVLARLGEPDLDAPVPRPPVPSFLTHLPVPGPMRPYLADLDGWKHKVPGVRQVRLPLRLDDTEVTLVEMRAGMNVPMHSHHGVEVNFLLSGGFDDITTGETYLPGDLSFRYGDHSHSITMHSDEPCVVIVILDGPLKPQTWLGRAMAAMGSF